MTIDIIETVIVVSINSAIAFALGRKINKVEKHYRQILHDLKSHVELHKLEKEKANRIMELLYEIRRRFQQH